MNSIFKWDSTLKDVFFHTGAGALKEPQSDAKWSLLLFVSLIRWLSAAEAEPSEAAGYVLIPQHNNSDERQLFKPCFSFHISTVCCLETGWGWCELILWHETRPITQICLRTRVKTSWSWVFGWTVSLCLFLFLCVWKQSRNMSGWRSWSGSLSVFCSIFSCSPLWSFMKMDFVLLLCGKHWIHSVRVQLWLRLHFKRLLFSHRESAASPRVT